MKTTVTMDDIVLAASSVGLELDASEKDEMLLHLQKQVKGFSVIDEVSTDGVVMPFGAGEVDND